MNDLYAKVLTIKEVLSLNLEIPNYQRPYRWTEKNVLLFLEDIYKNWQSKKSVYRVGSLIMHKPIDSNILKIVDGQQRITTVLLILGVLNKSDLGKNLINSLKFNHAISKINIKLNSKFIEEWITENIQDGKEGFYTYLVKKCEFVKIVVTDISEAFQMFDSQNGRGKELKAYNLLKAYHIRAMDMDDQTIKINADRKWEDSTLYKINKKETKDLLNQIFQEQVYRTRLWSRKEEAFHFTKHKIDEFKGLTLGGNHIPEYAYQNTLLLQHWANMRMQSMDVEIKGLKSRFSDVNSLNINPFMQINQNLLNGNSFFKYIETYVEIYKQLFIVENQYLSKFKDFFNEYCLTYKGYTRSGDSYLREVYKSAIFLLFDKYGEEFIYKYYKIIYSLIYKYRLTKQQVKYNAIAKAKNIIKVFTIIENSKNDLDLLELKKQLDQKIEVKFAAKKVYEFFKNGQEYMQLEVKDTKVKKALGDIV